MFKHEEPTRMNAIEQLMDEHQTILRVLASLEALVSDDTHAAEPVETLREATRFLRDFADRFHHAKEEDLLFPAMEAAGIPARQGPTEMMRHEHEQGRMLVQRLTAITEADDPDFDRAAFAEPAMDFVQLLRAHIGKEDHILYPMASRVVPAEALARLDEACVQADAANFEAEMPVRWRAWASELAGRLGVDREHFEAAPACH